MSVNRALGLIKASAAGAGFGAALTAIRVGVQVAVMPPGQHFDGDLAVGLVPVIHFQADATSWVATIDRPAQLALIAAGAIIAVVWRWRVIPRAA
jgi:hypothetical protein